MVEDRVVGRVGVVGIFIGRGVGFKGEAEVKVLRGRVLVSFSS